MATTAHAQTYTVIDLTPDTPFNTAEAISGGVVAGSRATAINNTIIRATLWDNTGATDLHPPFADDPTNNLFGRSSAEGISGNLQVGWAYGPGTSNRSVPVAWNGTAASARLLQLPFSSAGSQALATDGSQIVGYAIPFARDNTTTGAPRAMLWDAKTGAAIDLGDGGKGAQAFGVGGGKQVGYVIKSSFSAALWSGSSRTLISLHPKNAVTSVANATDGARQVGYSGYDIRIRAEAVGGANSAIFSYATVWTGTSASASVIHPIAANAPSIAFTHSYATAVSGPWIAGYANDKASSGTPAYNHAIVWDSSLQAIDLNAFLPAGFIGSQALGVDSQGNVSGVMTKADGTRHAVVWVLDPAS